MIRVAITEHGTVTITATDPELRRLAEALLHAAVFGQHHTILGGRGWHIVCAFEPLDG